jgi:hypothetical protein
MAGQCRHLAGGHPDQDVAGPLRGVVGAPGWVDQRGEDRLGGRAPQVVDDQVVGPLGGDRRGQLVARAVDPDRGIRPGRHELVEDTLVASRRDDARAVALGQLDGDPAGRAGRGPRPVSRVIGHPARRVSAATIR